ncbi:MAG: SDR family NAD(P)-dependent oxidoreductase [bacterium]|nr:SDR family NAD(P)-dependent oxidoreductase [bacterium]
MSAELFDLSGQVALCTGGSSGIGRRMAGARSRAGANVVLIGRRAEAISEALTEINDSDSGKAAGLVADLLDRDWFEERSLCSGPRAFQYLENGSASAAKILLRPSSSQD